MRKWLLIRKGDHRTVRLTRIEDVASIDPVTGYRNLTELPDDVSEIHYGSIWPGTLFVWAEDELDAVKKVTTFLEKRK